MGNGILDERLFALQDPNWSMCALVSIAGIVQERYAYEPYGTPTFLTPAFGATAASIFNWDVLYAGYRIDSSTGLFMVRNRPLNPLVGWLVRDPIELVDTRSLVEYAGSSPVQFSDAFGLQVESGYPEFIDFTGVPRGSTGAAAPGKSAGDLNREYILKCFNEAPTPGWVAVPAACGYMQDRGQISFRHDEMVRLYGAFCPKSSALKMRVLPRGCFGIVEGLLGRYILGKDFENCFISFGDAARERDVWRNDGRCCENGAVGPGGKPATAQIFAYRWSPDGPLLFDNSGRLLTANAPNRLNQDFGYYDESCDKFWHANQGGITGDISLVRFLCSTPKTFTAGKTFTIYCVACEGGGTERDYTYPEANPNPE